VAIVAFCRKLFKGGIEFAAILGLKSTRLERDGLADKAFH
jgi:hypothetical protein